MGDSDELFGIGQFRTVVEHLPSGFTVTVICERIADAHELWRRLRYRSCADERFRIMHCRLMRCWDSPFANPPDIRPELTIGHFDSVELESLPDLVHPSAACDGSLNFRPRPDNLPDLCAWRGCWQRPQVGQIQARFSRSAAAVHGRILGRFRGYCNSLKQSVNSLCTILNFGRGLQQIETVCQQFATAGSEAATEKAAKGSVVEHKGSGMQRLIFLHDCR